MVYNYDKYKPYRTYPEDYAEKWDGLAHLCREEGMLEVRFHTDDGPARFCEAMHAGYLGLPHEIGHEPDNKLLLITGTGDSVLSLADTEIPFLHVDPPPA